MKLAELVELLREYPQDIEVRVYKDFPNRTRGAVLVTGVEKVNTLAREERSLPSFLIVKG